VPVTSNVRPQKFQVLRSHLTSVAPVKLANTNPVFSGQASESRWLLKLAIFGAHLSLRSPIDPARARSPTVRPFFSQFVKRASRGRAAPRSQFFAVAAKGSASRFAHAQKKQPYRALGPSGTSANICSGFFRHSYNQARTNCGLTPRSRREPTAGRATLHCLVYVPRGRL
jgi:cell wall-associated NlpC family hydrolase